jgi:lipopolysaccharide transport system permease protein
LERPLTAPKTSDQVKPEPAVTPNAEPWDLVVGPHSSLIALDVKEVWRYRDLLYLFVRRDIVSFYKQTILGPIWFFVQPLLTTLMYVFVFGKIAGLSTDGLPRLLFYLAGVTFWNYFADCLNKTATVFKDNANLFGKVYFPRLITPLSIVFANLFRFAIQFSLFIVMTGYYYSHGLVSLQWTVFLFPLLVATMAMLALGMGMLFSALTTKYRDLAFLLQFGVQMLMYATPVIYPLSQVPTSLKPILLWNPLTPIFETARHAFLGQGQFDPLGLAYSVAFSVMALLVSTVIFNHVERTFMDTV